ncbi:LPXTG cell wall anchor domain-containing protein [Jatrophihabitans telluris]|uniref:LPXTG cell wall anchor domain-containing protein n=1 Tax=Jatrophihabitans telluris TaxID=2038343 RepID=A0ABY4QXT8_9ACTN|nr:LPXTG cell wall anchor domain-containing protein [Jatrophihabitans telluris]UQX88399.1 LPXTG cell wall anchor domain-containing protein [Jatrophihabitans telluris]
MPVRFTLAVLRRAVLLGSLALISGLALLGAPALDLGSRAAADSLPYTDPVAKGVIGLCGVDGKPLTAGNIHDKPFVWRAVSSVPAGNSLGGSGRVATLLAFQPRPNTVSAQWNGDTLTATSSYTNPAAPMAQATKIDFTLADFLNEYPAMVDGLIELRMYFGARGVGTDTSSYPATDIRITGDTWSVVRGGAVDCGSGSATSSELAALGKDKVGGTPAPRQPVSTSPRSSTGGTAFTAPVTAPAGSAGSGSAAVGRAGAGSSSAPASAAPAANTAATSARSASSTGTGTAWLVAGGLLVLAVAGGLWWLRRRGPRSA